MGQHRKIAVQGVSHLGSVDNIHSDNEHDTQAEYQYEKLRLAQGDFQQQFYRSSPVSVNNRRSPSLS